MSIDWKKSAIVLIDIAIAVYLVLAITAFNRPDELYNVCSEVKIDIQEGAVKGFLNPDEIKAQLQHAHLYPLGDPMEQVNSRKIEEKLLQNPFVESAQCYKTQSGRVHITLSQRLPVIRVKADNGDDYYVDTYGNIMPNTQYVSDLVIATGQISRPYAQKVLSRVGNFLIRNKLWFCQAEQINVLDDGTIEMIPRVGEHIVYLGQPTGLSRKFSRLEKFYKYGLPKAGWNKYSYISVEFDNQIICKKRNRKL
ncbi:MAG: cell division protein FtsQ [Prevotella sp.]|nr:cell division protein FtsQ [Prevotella sp.]